MDEIHAALFLLALLAVLGALWLWADAVVNRWLDSLGEE